MGKKFEQHGTKETFTHGRYLDYCTTRFARDTGPPPTLLLIGLCITGVIGR